jgi:hypothetical protein
MTHTTPPALYADHRVTSVQNTKFDCVHDAPLQASINVFLPRNLIKVRPRLVEGKRIDTAVEMGVSGGASIASDHDDGANGAVFAKKSSRFPADHILVADSLKRISKSCELT